MLMSHFALELHPFLGAAIVLQRNEIAAVEVRRMRVPLFWQTLLVFWCENGDRIPEMFVPIRRRRASRILRELGWPVRDGTPISWREVLSVRSVP
jgi:hypothetical protein